MIVACQQATIIFARARSGNLSITTLLIMGVDKRQSFLFGLALAISRSPLFTSQAPIIFIRYRFGNLSITTCKEVPPVPPTSMLGRRSMTRSAHHEGREKPNPSAVSPTLKSEGSGGLTDIAQDSVWSLRYGVCCDVFSIAQMSVMMFLLVFNYDSLLHGTINRNGLELQKNIYAYTSTITKTCNNIRISEIHDLKCALLLLLLTVPAQCPYSARTVPTTVPTTVPNCKNTHFFNSCYLEENRTWGHLFFIF